MLSLRPAAVMAVLAAVAAAWTGAAAAAADAPAADAAAKRVRKKKSPLAVRKILPRHGSRFVDLRAQVRIKFSAPVDAATLTPGNVVFRHLLGEPVDVTTTLENGGKTVVLTPQEPLDPGSDYELLVLRGVTKVDGTLLRRTARSIFYTDNRFTIDLGVNPADFEELPDSMNESRAAHTGTLIENGTILLAGGESETIGTLCQAGDVYDARDRSFYFTSTLLNERRAYHTATRWGQNGALLVGGWNGVRATASAEIYEGSSRSFVLAAPMSEQRDFRAAVRRADGRTLVTGGLRYVPAGVTYSTTAEILGIDGVWRTTASAPLRRRAGHTLTLLDDGTVLVVGGVAEGATSGPSAEIYDPATDSFRFVPNAPHGFRQLHTATALEGGARVLLADGGDAIVEVYERATGTFHPATGSSFVNRTRATATALPSGDVLIAGGLENRVTETLILQSMDIYRHAAASWGRVYYLPVIFREPRAAHTATTLEDGRVLFAGGYGLDVTNLASAVLLTPAAPKTPK